MIEDEKKAIIELNHYINITAYWKQEEYTNSEIDNYIKIVLSLIKKQQKEIEEIRQWKYTIDTYEDLDRLKALDLIKIKGKEYISKDKIKEKIKELESHIWIDDYMTKFDEYAIHYLKELLGEYIMSEEEKEAIERLDYFEPDDLVECAMYRDCVEKIKKLIEKQQKEIEQLKNLYSDEKIRNTIIKNIEM